MPRCSSWAVAQSAGSLRRNQRRKLGPWRAYGVADAAGVGVAAAVGVAEPVLVDDALGATDTLGAGLELVVVLGDALELALGDALELALGDALELALGDVDGDADELGTTVGDGSGGIVGGGGLNMPAWPKSSPYTRISAKTATMMPTQIFDTGSSM
jgi:ABC-type Fe3+-hydroxamate transport system substrate-binding protein